MCGCCSSAPPPKAVIVQPRDVPESSPSPRPDFHHHHILTDKFSLTGRVLGRGRHTTVYECGLPRGAPTNFFALKIMPRLLSYQREVAMLQRLQREGEQHQNIVALLDHGCDDSQGYVLLEACVGGTLHEHLVTHGALAEQDARQMFAQLVSAVVYMHTKGVAHRDLKPENVLRASRHSLVVKVCDLGNASLIENSESGALEPGKRGATWVYAPPEVVNNGECTSSVDAWGLGVLLFMMLAGYAPFDPYGDATRADTLHRIASIEFDFEDPQWESVSGEAKHLIRQLLAPVEKRLSVHALVESPYVQDVDPSYSTPMVMTRTISSLQMSYDPHQNQ